LIDFFKKIDILIRPIRAQKGSEYTFLQVFNIAIIHVFSSVITASRKMDDSRKLHKSDCCQYISFVYLVHTPIDCKTMCKIDPGEETPLCSASQLGAEELSLLQVIQNSFNGDKMG
jgi:hypothetical protein